MKTFGDVNVGDYIYMLKWHAKTKWLEIRRCHVRGVKPFGKRKVEIDFGHFSNTQDARFHWMKQMYASLVFNKDDCTNKEHCEKSKPEYLILAEFNEDIVSDFEKQKRDI